MACFGLRGSVLTLSGSHAGCIPDSDREGVNRSFSVQGLELRLP